jgi:hypothetical protein
MDWIYFAGDSGVECSCEHDNEPSVPTYQTARCSNTEYHNMKSV